jgi:exonuclease SbcC
LRRQRSFASSRTTTSGSRPASGSSTGEPSLALALALVEIATRGSGQLDALFLDEGFGSLDTASLDQALATLGAIATGGKLVALISHLHRVAEGVEHALLVERDDLLGSRVKPLTADALDRLLAEDARSGLTA